MVAEHLADATAIDFDEFYRTQFVATVRFLKRMGAAHIEAEDAAQSAMESVFQNWHAIRDRPPWVRVVARNNWIDMTRHRNRTTSTETFDAGSTLVDVPSADGDPVGAFHHKVERDDAARAMSDLPRTQREIFALVVDGYRPSEIASMLGRSPGVVRSNLAHARRRMRVVYAGNAA